MPTTSNLKSHGSFDLEKIRGKKDGMLRDSEEHKVYMQKIYADLLYSAGQMELLKKNQKADEQNYELIDKPELPTNILDDQYDSIKEDLRKNSAKYTELERYKQAFEFLQKESGVHLTGEKLENYQPKQISAGFLNQVTDFIKNIFKKKKEEPLEKPLKGRESQPYEMTFKKPEPKPNYPLVTTDPATYTPDEPSDALVVYDGPDLDSGLIIEELDDDGNVVGVLPRVDPDSSSERSSFQQIYFGAYYDQRKFYDQRQFHKEGDVNIQVNIDARQFHIHTGPDISGLGDAFGKMREGFTALFDRQQEIIRQQAKELARHRDKSDNPRGDSVVHQGDTYNIQNNLHIHQEEPTQPPFPPDDEIPPPPPFPPDDEIPPPPPFPPDDDVGGEGVRTRNRNPSPSSPPLTVEARRPQPTPTPPADEVDKEKKDDKKDNEPYDPNQRGPDGPEDWGTHWIGVGKAFGIMVMSETMLVAKYVHAKRIMNDPKNQKPHNNTDKKLDEVAKAIKKEAEKDNPDQNKIQQLKQYQQDLGQVQALNVKSKTAEYAWRCNGGLQTQAGAKFAPGAIKAIDKKIKQVQAAIRSGSGPGSYVDGRTGKQLKGEDYVKLLERQKQYLLDGGDLHAKGSAHYHNRSWGLKSGLDQAAGGTIRVTGMAADGIRGAGVGAWRGLRTLGHHLTFGAIDKGQSTTSDFGDQVDAAADSFNNVAIISPEFQQHTQYEDTDALCERRLYEAEQRHTGAVATMQQQALPVAQQQAPPLQTPPPRPPQAAVQQAQTVPVSPQSVQGGPPASLSSSPLAMTPIPTPPPVSPQATSVPPVSPPSVSSPQSPQAPAQTFHSELRTALARRLADVEAASQSTSEMVSPSVGDDSSPADSLQTHSLLLSQSAVSLSGPPSSQDSQEASQIAKIRDARQKEVRAEIEAAGVDVEGRAAALGRRDL